MRLRLGEFSMVLSTTLSFTDLILVSTVLLFFVFLAIQFIARKKPGSSLEDVEKINLHHPMLKNALNAASLITTLLVLALSFLIRDSNWFILRLLSLCFITAYAYFNPHSKVTIFYIMINVIAACVAPMVSLGFTAGEADQIGHVMAANVILGNGGITPVGHLSSVQLTSLTIDQYYLQFPVLDYLIGGLSLLTGLNPFVSLGILQVLIPVIGILGVTYVTRLFTADYLAPVVALTIILATDRLALWFLIPQNLALFFALLAFLPLLSFLKNPHKLMLWLTILFVVFATFIHASFGGLFLFALPLLALGFWWKKVGYWSIVKSTVLVIAIAILSYWTIWNVTTSVNSRLGFVLSTFLSAFSGSAAPHLTSKASLLALSSGYAFLSWAVPAAISASYVVYKLVTTRLRTIQRMDYFLLPMTAVGLVILGVGLFSTYGRGSLGLERYTDIPAYSAFLVTASVVVANLIRSRIKIVVALVVMLLFLSLFLGATQLNWAPDQFQSSYSYTTYQDFYATRAIQAIIPAGGADIYRAPTLDYIFYWNYQANAPGSQNKTIIVSPNLIASIDANRSVSQSYFFSYSSTTNEAVTYFFLGNDQFVNYSASTNSLGGNIVYSDGQYIGLMIYGSRR